MNDVKPHYRFDDPAQISSITGTANVTRKPASPVVIGRFSEGSHTSSIQPTNSATLVVPVKTRGRLRAELGGTNFESDVQPGAITFAPPNATQFYDFEGQTTNIVMGLKKTLFDQVIDADVGFTSIGILEPEIWLTSPRLEQLVGDYLEDALAEETGWSLVAEANALRIAIELFRIFGTPARGGGQTTNTALSDRDLGTIRGYLDSNMDASLSVSDLAGLVGRDVFSFTRAFKTTTGQTPHRYLIQLRLDRARDLLTNTDRPLADIAYACGFSSQAHMTSTFTKHLGVSPGRYRRELRK